MPLERLRNPLKKTYFTPSPHSQHSNRIMKAFRKAIRWVRRDDAIDLVQRPLQPFCLPSPVSDWPFGTGFATGHICIGGLDLVEITTFDEVWSTCPGVISPQEASFFKPINIPAGYHCLGYYGQANTGSIDGSVLVAKEASSSEVNLNCADGNTTAHEPALAAPVDYTLVWSSSTAKANHTSNGYFWLPCPPDGYSPLGYIVTDSAEKPSLMEVMCVHADLTDCCKTSDMIWSSKSSKSPFNVWHSYPARCGKDDNAVLVGTFCCSNSPSGSTFDINVSCLKCTAPTLSCMPTLDQVHALMSTFGPVFFFHPKETYLPSSVSWFFEQGALLCRRGQVSTEKISSDGSNLPVNAADDGEYWINLPNDGTAEVVKKGNLTSAKVYVQVKPMMGGTFTDLVVWIYYPFNGPSIAKLGMIDVPLGKIGEHVSDWEHITLRVSNFTGHLRKVYFAQHSGGYWVPASALEYVHGNKPAVYASRHGHASYPHPGLVLQGDNRVGVGIRNDTEKSTLFLDAWKNYQIISAEYLHAVDPASAPQEPVWLHYACEWGPKVQYNSRAELDKILLKLPGKLRRSLETLVTKLPHELSGEQGPSGPRHKNYWAGDERVKYH